MLVVVVRILAPLSVGASVFAPRGLSALRGAAAYCLGRASHPP